jgi:hypothetical protein
MVVARNPSCRKPARADSKTWLRVTSRVDGEAGDLGMAEC